MKASRSPAKVVSLPKAPGCDHDCQQASVSLKQTRTKFGIEQPEGDVLHNADEILKTATITWVTSLVLDTLRTCKDKIKLRGLLAKDLENLERRRRARSSNQHCWQLKWTPFWLSSERDWIGIV